MKILKETKFFNDFLKTCDNMYRLGWDERNGGNISLLLSDEEAAIFEGRTPERVIPIPFTAKELKGRFFMVTGTGKYFKNVLSDPDNNVGIFRISEDGNSAELFYGYADGGRFTSELPAHLMSHIVRLKADPENRVIMHSHPTNLLAMSFVHELDSAAFTHTLWSMNTECIVVFPDGVEVLPWMVCGTNAIGEATAEKMRSARVVIWAMHGIYGAGKSLDEAFGLVETVEKAAEIYMMTAPIGWKNTITDSQLKSLADSFGITPRKGILKA